MRSLRFSTCTLDNSTGHAQKREFCKVCRRFTTLSLSSLSRLLLVCTAKMLHGVYRIGGKAPLPPPALCCRLPDCWSIKIIVMEIDLIDNVPRSHCEQLVPCEHNPGTSSKNFSPQTSNPSSSFCPSLQKMKTEGCQGRQNPHLSSTSKTGRHVK